MQVGQFPASAANSLIQGYCDDFVSLAAILAQTLEQVSMRGLNFDGSRPALQRIEHGMRNLAEAIHDLLERGQVAGDLCAQLAEAPPPAPPPGRSGPAATPPAAATAGPARTTPAAQSAQPAAARTNQPAAGTPAAPARQPSAAKGAPAPSAPPPAAPPTPAATNTRPAARLAAPPAAGQRQAPVRPASDGLKGTSQSMPLLSVFQFLGRMRKAGTMRVSLGNENLTFELQNGCILATTSTQGPREELLGEILVAMGACPAEELDPIVVRVGTGSNERFGQAAVDAGLVSEAQVSDALGRQANLRYARACKHGDAKYEFVEGLRNQAPSRFVATPVAVA